MSSMSVTSDDHGNHHFYLKPNEIARLDFDSAYCTLSINSGTRYKLPLAQLRQIIAEGSQALNYSPSPHEAALRACLEGLGIDKGVCVDIGAFDGVNHSNTFALMQAGWSGLQVEYDRNRFASLAHTYRAFEQASLARLKVTPDNVCALLQSHGIPTDFDFLSLDIDSYDYYVLEALLGQYRPTLIMAEVNEVIPLPVKFAVKYDPELSFDVSTRFYGQSLAQLQSLCARYDYAVLDMYYMDVFMIDARYVEGGAPNLTEIYQRGFLSRPRPPYYADYPFDVEALLQASPEQAVELVKQGFSAYSGRFECRL